MPHGYLTAERVNEIAGSLFRGESFPCHKTTKDTQTRQQCVGAEVFLIRQGMSTQLGRIAERLGMAASIDMDASICGSVREMLEIHDKSVEELEPCHISDPGCNAPAGLLIGRGVVEGIHSAEYVCYGCGLHVCGNCSQKNDGEYYCKDCFEPDVLEGKQVG